MSFFGKSEQKNEMCSETHLHKLLAKREELQQSLAQSRKQLTEVLQSDVLFNGEAKTFGELEEQIRSLDDAIEQCRSTVENEKQDEENKAKHIRKLKYNVAARESQEVALDLDSIAIEFGETLEEFLAVTAKAQSLGAEFGIRGKPILERDFHSILTQLHSVFQSHLKLQRSIGEKRRSFGGFAAGVLPEESQLVGVEELNKSGWFTLTYSDGIIEKVSRSKLSEYLSAEQMEKLNA